ncbi:hypothetical protein NCAS_0A07920 [Naumovozyma castellii]|uniref:Uncharacterized protein n=1 Tax=Naumovozyma castellii TaxID=27288 RepID=G0V7A2_NAUCA|nr:hypothetical protein NCAS_0A07920 [Naumovozyma castellii CBS 4309]CCC67350.1 hypothetical protein NCAS_0A07920 [Naumovozyma castellii CBS 4309]
MTNMTSNNTPKDVQKNEAPQQLFSPVGHPEDGMMPPADPPSYEETIRGDEVFRVADRGEHRVLHSLLFGGGPGSHSTSTLHFELTPTPSNTSTTSNTYNHINGKKKGNQQFPGNRFLTYFSSNSSRSSPSSSD